MCLSPQKSQSFFHTTIKRVEIKKKNHKKCFEEEKIVAGISFKMSSKEGLNSKLSNELIIAIELFLLFFLLKKRFFLLIFNFWFQI